MRLETYDVRPYRSPSQTSEGFRGHDLPLRGEKRVSTNVRSVGGGLPARGNAGDGFQAIMLTATGAVYAIIDSSAGCTYRQTGRRKHSHPEAGERWRLNHSDPVSMASDQVRVQARRHGLLSSWGLDAPARTGVVVP